MNDIGYKTAYLHLFNRITDLIAVLERDGKTRKRFPLLKRLQQQAERISSKRRNDAVRWDTEKGPGCGSFSFCKTI